MSTNVITADGIGDSGSQVRLKPSDIFVNRLDIVKTEVIE